MIPGVKHIFIIFSNEQVKAPQNTHITRYIVIVKTFPKICDMY